MKKLIVLFVLVAFAGFASAELYELTDNLGFEGEPGAGNWSSWGSGSGSGPSGYAWRSHWAYVDTTGTGAGGSQNFMAATTASQVGYSESWGWGYDVIWRNDIEILDWTPNPGPGADVAATVTMGAWAKDLLGNGATLGMTFEWVDWSGGDAGGGSGGTIPRDEIWFATTTDWAYYEVTLSVPTSGNGNNVLSLGGYGMRPVWGVTNPGQLLGIDDVSAIYVPEPMSIALLGLGGLFLRRRK